MDSYDHSLKQILNSKWKRATISNICEIDKPSTRTALQE